MTNSSNRILSVKEWKDKHAENKKDLEATLEATLRVYDDTIRKQIRDAQDSEAKIGNQDLANSITIYADPEYCSSNLEDAFSDHVERDFPLYQGNDWIEQTQAGYNVELHIIFHYINSPLFSVLKKELEKGGWIIKDMESWKSEINQTFSLFRADSSEKES